jgi:glycosyltransferase involved in cell wall biosynthesis
MEKILSIIIPTYNMEKYLRKCLDSLLIPSIDAVEVLVLNDGSKDSSLAIAHEYAAMYPSSIIVVDKENGNYGSCINRGLKEATGKYIKVLDADDSFDTDNFEKYVQLLKTVNVDMLLTDYVIVNEQGDITNKTTFGIPSSVSLSVEEYCINPNFVFQMHAVTYRTQILKDMGYEQTEGVSYTDQEWVFAPVVYMKTFVYLPIALYKYLVGREGQTVSSAIALKAAAVRWMLIKKRVELYENNKPGFNLSQRTYLLNRLQISILGVMRNSIFEEQNLELTTEFDKWLLSKNHELYNLISTHKRAKIMGYNFVKAWRKKYRVPLFVRLINALKK